MSFDEIFDLTAGVYFYFFCIVWSYVRGEIPMDATITALDFFRPYPTQYVPGL